MTLANVVRLNMLHDRRRRVHCQRGVLAERTGAAGVAPAGTLLGIVRLAFPELMIELEATAVA